jgi:hypothetical protein
MARNLTRINRSVDAALLTVANMDNIPTGTPHAAAQPSSQT